MIHLPKMTKKHVDVTSGRFVSIDVKLKCHLSCTKGAFRKKHNKLMNVDISITLIYYPVDIYEHGKMIDFVSDFLTNLSPKKSVILCQDSNAKVGMYYRTRRT